jgi:SAM-dependent methyltransferase
LSTPGEDRSLTADGIFPDDLSGKTVLDVGCRYGFFCFEALKRGAARVVGVDFDGDALRKARLLAECKGANAEFIQLDLEADTLPGPFDYVLGLNILHHMRDPFAVLEKLVGSTSGHLVLEVASFNPQDAKKLAGKKGWAPFLLYRTYILPSLLGRLPVVGIGGNKRHIEEMFFISPSALERILRNQYGCFPRIRTIKKGHKGRFITIAEKLKVDRLVAVCGPCCAGKSTLVSDLRDNRHPSLSGQLGLGDGSDWTLLFPNELEALPTPNVEKVLFDYDFLRPYLRGPFKFERDRTLEIFQIAREIKTVTLWSEAAELHSRMERREILPQAGRTNRRQGHKRRLKILEDYKDAGKVRQFYEKWFTHLRGLPGDHYVVDLTAGEQLIPLSEWSFPKE